MEKNKKIIVIAVFVICFSILAGFVYMTFSEKMKEDRKSKFEFDVPEFSNKKESSASKLDYYNNQIDEENIKKGYLLKKEDSIKKALEITDQEEFYKREDFQEDFSDSQQQNNFSKESSNEGKNQENLSRLLSAMESNSKYLNNIGKEQPSAVSNRESIQGSIQNDVLEIVEDMPNKTDKDLVKGVYEKYMPERGESSEKSENISGRIMYKEVPREDLTKNAFNGVTKNRKVFNGIVSDNKLLKKELVMAEIYTNQVIGNGGLVMINLLEDLYFEEDFFIPKSTVLYGTVKFSVGRMFISISPNVFKNDKRLLRPVIVFDFDGLEGVFIETNLIGSIPVETARELTELVKESYKNANPLTGNAGAVPLKQASMIIGSEKILQYLNRLKLKIAGGYKIWISVEKRK